MRSSSIGFRHCAARVVRPPEAGTRRAGAFACLAVVSLACAGAPLAPDSLALPPGSVQTPLGRGMRLYGMPADVRLLDMPVPIAQAIPFLTARYPVLSDLGVYPGLAVLSGHAAGQHWVAALEPAGPRRTRGSLSVLAASGDAGVAASRRPGWLPANARLRLDFGIDDGDGHTTQQVWTLASPVATARRAIDDGLRRAGWRREAAASESSAAGHWARGRVRLQITITAAEGGGSGILLQRHDEVSP